MSHDIPHATPEPIPEARLVPRFRAPISLIWIVPLVAILIGVGLVVNAVIQRGPEIELQFASAEGLDANKTKLKYKDVAIGTVTTIELADDHHSVKATVQVDKQAAPLLVEDSRFWVVRPRIVAGGVSGLGTLLSGAYIALDPGKSGSARRRFVGLESPPLVVGDMPGRQFILAADDLGSLDIGVPVYHRHVPVGRVVGYAMRPDGKGVDVRIFVDAPYDRFVTATTRFWHASGIDLSVGADGMKLETQSLLSVVAGGVAFASGDESGNEAPAESSFTLFPDQASAMREPDTIVQKYVLVFDESVRGLAVGAPVDFRGLVAGEVSRIDIDFKRGTSEIMMVVEINLYPERFTHRLRVRPATVPTTQELRQTLDAMVAKGFRAQLRTGNLLTGQRYVALDFFPKAKAAAIKWSRQISEMPTESGSLDSLPEQLLSAVGALKGTLQRTDRLIAHVDQDIVPELAPTLREVGRAATSVRNLADLLEQQPEALLTGKKDRP
jgi:paraquat-inducible protein B